MEKRNNGISEADDFWELDDLLPRRRLSRDEPSDTSAVDVVFGEDSTQHRAELVITPRITDRPDAAEPTQRPAPVFRPMGESAEPETSVTEYVPKNPLISRVVIVKRSGYLHLAVRMLSDMHRLFDREASFTENVEYSSYFPQYSNMTERQLECYLGFRTEVRKGRFPKVSESYIYMLLYEIINMTERIRPEEGARMLCSLMLAYRGCSESLFSNMCDWLEDLCLINELECPFAALEPVRGRICKLASWKEFYIPFRSDGISPDAFAMLTAASAYDYKKSYYYNAANAQMYDKHIPAAFDAAISRISGEDPRFSPSDNGNTRLTRESFRGALCSPTLKRTVTVECVCFTRSPLVRQTVTGLVKLAENHVRELLGIHSRLTVSCLGAEKRRLVAEYFEPYLKQKSAEDARRRARASATDPEAGYERLYEPRSTGFSPQLAAEIEKASWQTTELLLQAFEEPQEPEQTAQAQTERHASETPHAPSSAATPTAQISPPQSVNTLAPTALGLLLRGDTAGFFRLAASASQMPETLADEINELACEAYGDIGVIFDGNTPRIEEEYREELESLAQQSERTDQSPPRR